MESKTIDIFSGFLGAIFYGWAVGNFMFPCELTLDGESKANASVGKKKSASETTATNE
ncbi:MAG: hypothetical protein II921_02080 [Treponema sp.]|nr:hypothetical protein [Treponema sp.]